MQAIITKYLPATNFKGSRIKATCERGSITISTGMLSGTNEENNIHAAQCLVDKFVNEDKTCYGKKKNPWSKPRAVGQLPNGDYAHVFI